MAELMPFLIGALILVVLFMLDDGHHGAGGLYS